MALFDSGTAMDHPEPEVIHAYFTEFGNISQELSAQIKRHISECKDCQEIAAYYHRLARMIKDLGNN